MNKSIKLRNKVVLTAFDFSGNKINEIKLNYDDYYENLHALIDKNAYRVKHMIRKLLVKYSIMQPN